MIQTVDKGNWSDRVTLKDMRGQEFAVGDKVARAYTSGRSANLEVREVTAIHEGRIYLGGSKVPIKFPGRCLIVTKVYE